MKKTLIKIEYEKGSPPEIEINGRPLTSVAERAVFYIISILLALGAGWAIFYILLPLIGLVLKLLFSIIGWGFIMLGLVLVAAIVLGLLKWQFDKRRKNDFWND
jgi:hypothetical protein